MGGGRAWVLAPRFLAWGQVWHLVVCLCLFSGLLSAWYCLWWCPFEVLVVLYLASDLVLSLFFFWIISVSRSPAWAEVGVGSVLGSGLCRETERVGIALLEYSSLLFRAALPASLIFTASWICLVRQLLCFLMTLNLTSYILLTTPIARASCQANESKYRIDLVLTVM